VTRDQAIQRLNQIPIDLARKAIVRVCAVQGGDPADGVRYEVDQKWAEVFWRVQSLLDGKAPLSECNVVEVLEALVPTAPPPPGEGPRLRGGQCPTCGHIDVDKLREAVKGYDFGPDDPPGEGPLAPTTSTLPAPVYVSASAPPPAPTPGARCLRCNSPEVTPNGDHLLCVTCGLEWRAAPTPTGAPHHHGEE
jgi:hypothetical protein